MKKDSLPLEGKGAAYIRVSTEEQDTSRQYASVRKFAKDNGVTIPESAFFVDPGWSRDQAASRPEFNRLLRLVDDGKIQWIVVDQLDRFGTKDHWQFSSYIYRLREAGCLLFDSDGDEWTGEDIDVVMKAVVEGHKSKKEQLDKSYRVLSDKVEAVRRGEWQGEIPKLGLDVGCFDRSTGEEVWRVILLRKIVGKRVKDRKELNEYKMLRVKVFPDGREEEYDGKGNFPNHSDAQILRLVPSRKPEEIEAVVSLFQRYATESIGFTNLAQWLNGLRYRNRGDNLFQGFQVEAILRDPIYLGYYTWNKRHDGKFHRYSEGGVVKEKKVNRKRSRNDKADWVQSTKRLFDPLIDRPTWDAVQKKLDRPIRAKAPPCSAHFLSGLVYCGNCGGRMVGTTRKATKRTPKQAEYYCGTYHAYVRDGRQGKCECLRNTVTQPVLEHYISLYLEEAGKRLELLTGGKEPPELTGKLWQQEADSFASFREGFQRLTRYLAEHATDEYNRILSEYDADPSLTPDDFISRCLSSFQEKFDPEASRKELQRLEAELSRLVDAWADLPTKNAKEKAKEKLASLESRIEELKQAGENLAESVAGAYAKAHELQAAIASARIAIQKEGGERENRRKAEAIRGIIHRIECTFVSTGYTGAGGKPHSRLVRVDFYPVEGDSVEYETATVPAIRGLARMYG